MAPLRRWLALLPLLVVLATAPQRAYGDGTIKEYLNNAAQVAHATPDPAQKRAILEHAYGRLNEGLTLVDHWAVVSSADRVGIERINAQMQANVNELTERDGYAKVPDNRLDAYADYVVQDMEQADTYVSISIVTLLLLLILVVLIVR